MVRPQPTKSELDLLRETANIGSGHAATALSQLLGTPVKVRIPHVKVVPFDHLAERVGGAETVVMAVFFQLQGDIDGCLYVLMSEKRAKQLLGALFDEVDRGQEMTALHYSALAEAGNIVAGSYLSALADFTGLKVFPSVPYLTFDMAGAALSIGAAQIGETTDEALLIETEVTTSDISAKAHVLMLPQPEQLSALFQAMGVNDHDY